MKEELGDEWLRNDLFRIGASSLLIDIERQVSSPLIARSFACNIMPKTHLKISGVFGILSRR